MPRVWPARHHPGKEHLLSMRVFCLGGPHVCGWGTVGVVRPANGATMALLATAVRAGHLVHPGWHGVHRDRRLHKSLGVGLLHRH